MVNQRRILPSTIHSTGSYRCPNSENELPWEWMLGEEITSLFFDSFLRRISQTNDWNESPKNTVHFFVNLMELRDFWSRLTNEILITISSLSTMKLLLRETNAGWQGSLSSASERPQGLFIWSLYRRVASPTKTFQACESIDVRQPIGKGLNLGLPSISSNDQPPTKQKEFWWRLRNRMNEIINRSGLRILLSTDDFIRKIDSLESSQRLGHQIPFVFKKNLVDGPNPRRLPNFSDVGQVPEIAKEPSWLNGRFLPCPRWNYRRISSPRTMISGMMRFVVSLSLRFFVVLWILRFKEPSCLPKGLWKTNFSNGVISLKVVKADGRWVVY